MIKPEALKRETTTTTTRSIPTQFTLPSQPQRPSTHTSPLHSHLNLPTSSQSTILPSGIDLGLPTTLTQRELESLTLPQSDDDDVSLNSADGAVGFTPLGTEKLWWATNFFFVS